MNPTHREMVNSALSVALMVGTAVVISTAIVLYIPVMAMAHWKRVRPEGGPG
jgi:hypothetical protein